MKQHYTKLQTLTFFYYLLPLYCLHLDRNISLSRYLTAVSTDCKDMKAISPFLLGFLLLISGMDFLFAAPPCPVYGNGQNCSVSGTRTTPFTKEEKAQRRFLRRQHTREAYTQNDMTPTSFQDDDCHRYRKGKKMTADERMRLRQQIDEVGQSIYHQ